MNIETIVALGVQAAAIVEFIKQAALKQARERFGWSDDAYRAIVWVIVALVGALLSYSQNVVFEGWNPVASAIVAGIAASLPSSVLHALYEAVLGLRDKVTGADETPTTSPPPSVAG